MPCRIPILSLAGLAAVTIGAVQQLSAQAIPAACQPVIAAERKAVTTPSHSMMTSGETGKAATGEIIFTGAAMYVRSGTKWQMIAASSKEMLDRLNETVANSTNFVCQKVAAESVGGTIADVYQVSSEAGGDKISGKVWIARGTGLIVRQDSDMDSGNGPKTHLSMRYDYANVHAPAGMP